MDNNIKILREKFIKKFCKKMNWDDKNISTNQMLIISKKEDYKHPKF